MRQTAACLLLVSLAAIAACDSASPDTSRACVLSASTAASTIPVTVTYRATASAASTISTLTYRGAAGPVTVTRPPAMWEALVPLEPGVAPSITASGTAKDGQIAVIIRAMGQSGGTNVTLDGFDECQANAR